MIKPKISNSTTSRLRQWLNYKILPAFFILLEFERVIEMLYEYCNDLLWRSVYKICNLSMLRSAKVVMSFNIVMSITTSTKHHIHILYYLHLTENVQSIVCCLLEYLSKLTYYQT